MKALTTCISLLLFLNTITAQNVGINTDGSSPNAEAQLHLKTDDLQYGILNELTATGSGLSYGIYNDLLGNASGNYIGTINRLSNQATGFVYGTYNALSGDVSKEKYGTYNEFAGAGSRGKYGSYNRMRATEGNQYGNYSLISTDGSSYSQFGTYQSIDGDGSGLFYGTTNIVNGDGVGSHYGISNELGGSGNGFQYGIHTTISNDGIAPHYGSFIELSGSGTGLQVGSANEISNSSNGDHWGTYNELNGNGSGAHKGTYNLMLGSAGGNQIGSHQQLTISGDGIQAGTTNDLSGVGNGTHYGTKNSLSGTGTGIQYGTHNEITNTGGGLHYAGWFDAPGSNNNYAAVFNRGNVVANENGGKFDFRIESDNENAMLFVDGTNDRVGLGTDAPTATFHMQDNDASGRIILIENTNTSINADALAIKLGPTANPTTNNAYLAFRDGDNTVIGSITGNGAGATNFNTTSDKRLKMNIQDYNGGLSIISKIKARSYERISKPGEQEIGFIAQELYEVFPQVVSGSPDQSIDEPMAVDYGKLTPVLLAAIQELADQNQILKEQLAAHAEILEGLVGGAGGE